MQITHMDIEDMEVLGDLNESFSGNLVENEFLAYMYSPYNDFDMLWSVRRLYRMNHWIFWSPVDLLDKRYYVPLISDYLFLNFLLRMIFL